MAAKRLTVGELIELLQAVPKDWEVKAYCTRESSLSGGCEGYGWVYNVDVNNFDRNTVVLDASRP